MLSILIIREGTPLATMIWAAPDHRYFAPSKAPCRSGCQSDINPHLARQDGLTGRQIVVGSSR